MKGKKAKPGEELLMEARRHWESLGEFRRLRERCKRYTYGRQWDDPIVIDGERMTEEEWIRREGHQPLKNNLIRRMVRNILGTWLNNRTEPLCETSDTDGDALLAEDLNRRLLLTRERNTLREFTMRSMEEFLISGMVVWRKSYGLRDGTPDIRTDTVCPDNFFFDSDCCDPRCTDVEFLGEIHDVGFGRLCSMMADSPQALHRLAEIYSPARQENTQPDISICGDERFMKQSTIGFTTPSRPGMCRVIEIWRRERRPRYRCHDPKSGEAYKIEEKDFRTLVAEPNSRRLAEGKEAGIPEEEIPIIRTQWFIDETWRYTFLSPYGDILAQGDTPYEHGSHPYVFMMYPFIDGEIHSFVADVIDQQRHINRLITIFDWVMRASAKGVLLFPQEAMPDGWHLSDIASEWTRHNGVIMIKTKDGAPLPQQVSSNSVNIGIVELLNIQMQMLEDISGVNGALQGKLASGNVSGTLYDQQTQNALTSLLDILESFRTFEKEALRLDIALLKQYEVKEKSYGTDKKSITKGIDNFANTNK